MHKRVRDVNITVGLRVCAVQCACIRASLGNEIATL